MDLWKTTLTWGFDNQPHAQNVFYMRPTGAFVLPTQTDAANIRLTIFNASTVGTPARRSDWPNDYRCLRLELQSIDQPNRPKFLAADVIFGTGSNDALPFNVALALKLRTSATYNGRMFVPGLDESTSLATSGPSPDMVTRQLAMWNTVRQELPTTSGVQWVVYSRTLGTFAPIEAIERSTSSTLSGWQTMRRRRFPLS